MEIIISITEKGEVKADIVGGKGRGCMDVLAPLEDLLGQASQTGLKPEYQWDEEVVSLLKEVTA